ncbi:hypothetical protein [Nocardioides sp.]|uniref:hypothetical protein n=1 Tax=Nocardioides sp. TaxID=35761 RepID=UPI0035111D3B
MTSVVRLFVAFLWLLWPVASATGATTLAAATPHEYIYAAHLASSAPASDLFERGPPTSQAQQRLAADLGSRGVLARVDARAGAFAYDYDGTALSVQFNNVRGIAPEYVRETDMDRSSSRRWRVAAKAGDELAHLGQGWRATSFGDEAASFEFHFGKHGVEAGVTREQYAQDALNWARNPAGTGKLIQLKDGTEGLRYRTPGGGPGGITDLDGNIITSWYR